MTKVHICGQIEADDEAVRFAAALLVLKLRMKTISEVLE